MTTPILPPVHSRDSSGTALYEKTCADCGVVSVVDRRRLNCLCKACSGKRRKTHGFSVGGKLHPLYKLLKNIQARCNYPTATNYKYYGGRGIKVCDDWEKDPVSFVEWATSQGWEPGLEVDRINPDLGYTPQNCRLISHQENSQRTRRIKTTHSQVLAVRDALSAGKTIKASAAAAGVGYMVAWHIKNSPGVWSNV